MAETPGAETQAALARKAGIGQSHVSRVLKGAQSVGLDVVAAVSTALGCQPWELLANDEATRRAAMERMILGGSTNENESEYTPARRTPPPGPTKRVAHKRVPKR